MQQTYRPSAAIVGGSDKSESEVLVNVVTAGLTGIM